MKKIALVGSAPSSVHLAPYHDKSWEIWSCSPGAFGFIEGNKLRSDAHFEIHRWEPGQPWFSEGYVDWLVNFNGPVYMSEHVPMVKN